MSDAQTIKRLEANLEVATNKVNTLRVENKTLQAKAGRYQIATAAGNTINEIKERLGEMKVDGMTLDHLRSFTAISDLVDDFVRRYGGVL